MTTSNAAAVDSAAKALAQKGTEKLAEKRGALGGGLGSLLPGPRVGGGPANLHPFFGGAGISGLEDCWEDHDSCNCEAGFRAAGGGDDPGRESSAAGSRLSGASWGVFEF